MIRINLLPVRKKIKEQNIRNQITVGILIIVFSIFVMGYLYNDLSGELKETIDELGKKKKEDADLDKKVGDINKIQKKKKDLEAKLKVIKSLSENRLVIVKVLDEISQAKPEKLWLSKLEQSKLKGKDKSFDLKIQGKAISNEVIAQFMINLQKLAHFKNVDLVSTKQAGGGKTGIKLKQFDVISKVAIPKKKEKSKKASKSKKKRKK